PGFWCALRFDDKRDNDKAARYNADERPPIHHRVPNRRMGGEKILRLSAPLKQIQRLTPLTESTDQWPLLSAMRYDRSWPKTVPRRAAGTGRSSAALDPEPSFANAKAVIPRNCRFGTLGL